MRKSKVLTILSGMALVMTSLSAIAGQPLSMEKFLESEEPHVGPMLSDWCGTEILVSLESKGKVTVFDDFTTRTHVNYDWIMFNPANGAFVIERAAFNLITPDDVVIVDEDLRTWTLIIEETYKGLPLKWLQPGVGVLLRDAGTVTIQLTLVFDLDTSELLDDSLIILPNGPHPSVFLGEPENAEILCGALVD